MAPRPARPSRYHARLPDADGRVRYSAAEHDVWATLLARQRLAIADVACDAFIDGLNVLKLPADRIPQLAEVSARLRRASGWEVVAVPALIPFGEFFALLAARRFPAATFIRRREHLDYLQEPDIFHELFGHAPLLTDPGFAAFTETWGRIGLAASKEDRVFLARLYWFTVEFGLVTGRNALNGIAAGDERPAMDGRAGASVRGNDRARDGDTQRGGLKIYGGGILSSPAETTHALSGAPRLKPFDLIEVLRTPYRIDIVQPQYFVLDNLHALQRLTAHELQAAVAEARRLGLHAPLFPPKPLAA
jgi:phenylalanine-4-hydroxylase